MPLAQTPVIPALCRPVVLVVDDEPAVLEALRSLFEPRLEPVFRVESAGSAEEALEWAATHDAVESPIALVITDEKMPGLTGTDLLVALRRSPAHRHGGRIVVTGYAGLASAKRAINEAEVDRYYPKPWDAEGALLPAVGGILAEFARKSGLGRFVIAAPVGFPEGRARIVETRRAWWEYVNLMGMSAEEAGVESPAFELPDDAGAVHVLCEEVDSTRRDVAACVRLVPDHNGPSASLDQLCFQPGHAREEIELLVLRTALLAARARAFPRVTTEAPASRAALYESLGFRTTDDSRAQAGTLTMEMVPGSAGATDVPGRAYAARFASENRLCACDQTACLGRDYASARRGYFCPLDLAEGRVPAGFPAAPAR
jgi:CheY-like chemotaxis protein